MPFDVILTGPAKKIYNKLTPKLQAGLDRCITRLEASPKWGANIESLKGRPGCYRYQVGGWRILYRIDETINQVRIYEIGSRGDIYKH